MRMPYNKANGRDSWKGMQLRKVILDLDSSYLEWKALMPRKESSKHRVMKLGKNRAWQDFGDRLVLQWPESRLKIKRYNWKRGASSANGLPFAQVGLGLAYRHCLAGMKYLQGILERLLCLPSMVARRSVQSLWQESPACPRGTTT